MAVQFKSVCTDYPAVYVLDVWNRHCVYENNSAAVVACAV